MRRVSQGEGDEAEPGEALGTIIELMGAWDLRRLVLTSSPLAKTNVAISMALARAKQERIPALVRRHERASVMLAVSGSIKGRQSSVIG